MDIKEIEVKLQHEILSRHSKTSDEVSQEPLNDTLGYAAELISKLISKWLKADENASEHYQIKETLIHQFKQTNELILKLAGAVVWSREGESELKASPFKLFFTLDRSDLTFYSYGLYFGGKLKEGIPFESYQGNTVLMSEDDVEWRYNWSRNFKS
jgi:hypothetical protein